MNISSKSLKIAQLAPYYYPSIGGVQGVVKYISEELVLRGHSVDVITAFRDHKERPAFNAPKFEVLNGVRIFRYRSILNIGHMSIMPGLVKHLLKHKYDVLHYHNYRHPLCDISAFLGKIKKSINILHGHGPFFEEGEISDTKQKIYSLYDKLAKKIVLKWSDKIIALNNYELKRYLQIGIEEDKVVAIPNAADNDCFIDTDPSPFIEKYDLRSKRIILLVGILNAAKRPDILIQSLPQIINEVPETQLVLVGPDGGLLQRIEYLAKELDIEKSVTITGPLYGTEKHRAYEAAEIFVLPSDLESFGMVIIEAMAHSLPIVCTDARGPSDILNDGNTGFLVPKRDINKLAEKIILLLKNENLRKQFSTNANLIANEKYSVPPTTKKIEEIYFNLLSKKRR